MKTKILKLFNLQKIEATKFIDLDKIFEENKGYFEILFIKDFTGYIPKEVMEPTLKIFEDHAEMFERWTLWQSYYINRKVLGEPMKIPFYNGMLVYLKLLNTMARINKKSDISSPIQVNKNVETKTQVEDFIKDVAYFRENHGKDIQTDKGKNKGDKDTKSNSSQSGKSKV